MKFITELSALQAYHSVFFFFFLLFVPSEIIVPSIWQFSVIVWTQKKRIYAHFQINLSMKGFFFQKDKYTHMGGEKGVEEWIPNL